MTDIVFRILADIDGKQQVLAAVHPGDLISVNAPMLIELARRDREARLLKESQPVTEVIENPTYEQLEPLFKEDPPLIKKARKVRKRA